MQHIQVFVRCRRCMENGRGSLDGSVVLGRRSPPPSRWDCSVSAVPFLFEGCSPVVSTRVWVPLPLKSLYSGSCLPNTELPRLFLATSFLSCCFLIGFLASLPAQLRNHRRPWEVNNECQAPLGFFSPILCLQSWPPLELFPALQGLTAPSLCSLLCLVLLHQQTRKEESGPNVGFT